MDFMIMNDDGELPGCLGCECGTDVGCHWHDCIPRNFKSIIEEENWWEDQLRCVSEEEYVKFKMKQSHRSMMLIELKTLMVHHDVPEEVGPSFLSGTATTEILYEDLTTCKSMGFCPKCGEYEYTTGQEELARKCKCQYYAARPSKEDKKWNHLIYSYA